MCWAKTTLPVSDSSKTGWTNDNKTPECQSMAHLIKFFEVMRGTRMAAPSKLLPVMKMPLHIDIPSHNDHQEYGLEVPVLPLLMRVFYLKAANHPSYLPGSTSDGESNTKPYSQA